MAYMNQERKNKLAPAIKSVLKKYGIKGSISTDRHSLNVNLQSGVLDLIGNMNATCSNDPYQADRFAPVTNGNTQVNPYWFQNHFSGKAKKFLTELLAAMNDGNHDNSRIEVDYFDVGWYVNVNIGKWNKPYVVKQ